MQPAQNCEGRRAKDELQVHGAKDELRSAKCEGRIGHFVRVAQHPQEYPSFNPFALRASHFVLDSTANVRLHSVMPRCETRHRNPAPRHLESSPVATRNSHFSPASIRTDLSPITPCAPEGQAYERPSHRSPQWHRVPGVPGSAFPKEATSSATRHLHWSRVGTLR